MLPYFLNFYISFAIGMSLGGGLHDGNYGQAIIFGTALVANVAAAYLLNGASL